MKKLLIFALILLIVGGLIFGFAALAGGLDLNRNYTTTTHTVEEDFSAVFAELDESELTILPATDEKCTLVFLAHKNRPFSFTVRGETLAVSCGEKKITDYIFDILDFGSPKVTLYLPKNAYETLQIEGDTADITVDKAFTFERAEIETDTGDIRMNASVNGPTVLETDTGDIFIQGASLQSLEATADTGNITLKNLICAQSAEIEVDTGRLNIDTLSTKSLVLEGDTAKQTLKNLTVQNGIRIQNSTGDLTIEGARADSLTLTLSTGDTIFKNCIFASSLEVRTSTGDVKFEDADAPLITVNTGTGDVSGTLLSGKDFEAKSGTGSVSVPEDQPESGRCKVTTRTGRIKISIQ